MLLQLVAAVVLCGAVTADHTNEPVGLDREMGFEWESVQHSEFFTHLRSDWRESGLQFKISGNVSDFRELIFFSEELWYGSINWDESEFGIYGYNDPNQKRGIQAAKQSCNASGSEVEGTSNFIEYKNNMSNIIGTWTIEVKDNMLNLWHDKSKMVSLNISRCASWLMNEKIKVMKAMDFEVEFEDESPDEYRYAERVPHAADCLRGEFWWEEKCNSCPPGKSTVRQGDTTYEDCVDIRYISCKPKAEKLECVRENCPCDAYEECDRDQYSAMYGMCMKRSDYMSAGVSVTVSTGLLTLVTLFFSIME